ncbi:MAG: hypothetical protein IT383_25800 [Deltaproteobacteria bacterium]|nr:hypothetical protein [Deltaproteobacteria bacterium]
MTPGGLATRHSPSFGLIKAHFGLGLAGMLAFAGALLWHAPSIEGHFFQPALLGLVHLCVLGWFLPITLGAMHQMLPVVFEVPVRSERLAWAAWGVFLVGAAGLIVHLWLLRTGPGLVGSASLLFASLLAYVGNLVATLRRAKEVKLVGAFVVAALAWLVVAAVIGLLLAINLGMPFISGSHLEVLRAHAHAAALGFFGLLIMGVTFRLLEMFLVAYVEQTGPGVAALVLVNVALVALVVGSLLGAFAWLGPLAAALALAGVLAFLVQVARIFRARLRKRTDVAWWHTGASFGYLVAAVLLGGALASSRVDAALTVRLELAYGFLALPGFIGSVIVGQLSKIWPFLVWFHTFSAYVGLKEVPTASELLPEGRQRAQWLAMHAGYGAFLVGVLLPSVAVRVVGAVAFALSALVFAANMLKVARSRP